MISRSNKKLFSVAKYLPPYEKSSSLIGFPLDEVLEASALGPTRRNGGTDRRVNTTKETITSNKLTLVIAQKHSQRNNNACQRALLLSIII